MNIARPADGFAIRLEPRAQATLDSVGGSYSRIQEVWHGICQRIKMTAHREGRQLPNGELIMEFPKDAQYGIPLISVVFDVLGDTLTVKRILIVF
jgi:hypothetical protein